MIAAAGWTYINQDSGLELNAGLNMYGGARNGARCSSMQLEVLVPDSNRI